MIRQLATCHQVEQVKDGDFSSRLRDADVLVLRNHVTRKVLLDRRFYSVGGREEVSSGTLIGHSVEHF